MFIKRNGLLVSLLLEICSHYLKIISFSLYVLLHYVEFNQIVHIIIIIQLSLIQCSKDYCTIKCYSYLPYLKTAYYVICQGPEKVNFIIKTILKNRLISPFALSITGECRDSKCLLFQTVIQEKVRNKRSKTTKVDITQHFLDFHKKQCCNSAL